MNERRVRTTGRQTYGRAEPFVRPKRKRAAAPRLGLLQRRLILLGVLVAVILYGAAHLFAVTTVTVKSPARGEEIKVQAQKLIDDSWRMGNLLTINTGELAAQLQQADPLLRNVEVRRKWLHTVTIAAVLKQPSLGWSSGNQRYLLDRDGTAIGVLPQDSPLPVVVDGSNLPVELGKRVASARFVTFATEVAPALKAQGLVAQSLSIKDTTLDLSVVTDKGFRLIFDTGRTVQEGMADLKAVLALLVSQKKTPAEYIDLRISGKAYYK